MHDGTPPESPELDRLRHELEQREYEISLLRETALAVSSELGLENVLNLIAERARELVHAETLLVPILDAHSESYTYRAGSGTNADEIVGESLPLEFGVCGWVWRHKKAWWRGILDELSDEERTAWEKEAGTLILVPLQGRKQFLGGIAAINKQSGDDFDARDLQLLELFAGHAAIAIENAMAVAAMEEARQSAENYQSELQQLNRRLTVANEELEYLSLYDHLTGLPNRSLFRDRMLREIESSQTRQNHFCVLLIDLDRFKDVNDALGHEMGDRILKRIAHRLSSSLDVNHTLARISADEFAVLLCNSDSEEATRIAHHLRDTLKQAMQVDEEEVVITATSAIVVFPEHGGNEHELLKHVDMALSVAKSEKTPVRLFDPDHDLKAIDRFDLTQDLQHALDHQEFTLFYQPKIALSTGKAIGVEALARWHHPARGHVPTEMFITALENTGLISPFSYWVIESALQQRDTWLTQGVDLKIAVNIPITLILEADFLTNLQGILATHPPQPGLIFEITETIFMGDYERLNSALRQIQKLGIAFSIDDFGTGHSSLSRLRQLPVSELKIDKSFVMTMLDNKDDEAIVKLTIELAHSLGLQAVAEGVEDSAVLETLYRMRCDLIQGYHISKALPAGRLLPFLTASKWDLVSPAADHSGCQSNGP